MDRRRYGDVVGTDFHDLEILVDGAAVLEHNAHQFPAAHQVLEPGPTAVDQRGRLVAKRGA